MRMLVPLLRLPALLTAARRAEQSATPSPEPYAGLLVFAVWAGVTGLALYLVGRCAARIPFYDEYFNLPLLFTDARYSFTAYWSQHSEHRIPLPKLLYLIGWTLGGGNFRAMPFANAALLAAAAGGLILLARRLRGHTSVSDAFFPLVVAHPGHWENLVAGFQIQFVSSTLLVLGFLGLVLTPGFGRSRPRLVAAAVIPFLLGLCGSNGLALVPALTLFLAYVALRQLRAGDRVCGVVALLGSAAGAAIIPAYFWGLAKINPTATWAEAGTAAIGAVNFYGMAMGLACRAAHAPDYAGVAYYGAGMLSLVAVTAGVLVRRLADPDRRLAAAGVLAVLAGLASLGLGLAYGRSVFGNLLLCSRYVTLAMPLTVVVYFAWLRFAPSAAARVVTTGLLMLACLSFWPNAVNGFALADQHVLPLKRAEFDIRGGMPLNLALHRHPHVLPSHPDTLRASWEFLRARGVKPFDQLAPDRPLVAEVVPVRVLRAESVSQEGEWYQFGGVKSSLVLALPRRQQVYALRLTYEAEGAAGTLLSWEPGGSYPPRPGYAVADQLQTTYRGPLSTTILVDKETDCLRLDILAPGARVRFQALAVLTPGD